MQVTKYFHLVITLRGTNFPTNSEGQRIIDAVYIIKHGSIDANQPEGKFSGLRWQRIKQRETQSHCLVSRICMSGIKSQLGGGGPVKHTCLRTPKSIKWWENMHWFVWEIKNFASFQREQDLFPFIVSVQKKTAAQDSCNQSLGKFLYYHNLCAVRWMWKCCNATMSLNGKFNILGIISFLASQTRGSISLTRLHTLAFVQIC